MNIALIALFTVLGVGFVCAAADVLATRFGQLVLAGTSIFWLIRAVVQIPYFGWQHPASLALLAAFICGSVLHGAALMRP